MYLTDCSYASKSAKVYTSKHSAAAYSPEYSMLQPQGLLHIDIVSLLRSWDLGRGVVAYASEFRGLPALGRGLIWINGVKFFVSF